jgi:rhodanese-related sulfurtransferase
MLVWPLVKGQMAAGVTPDGAVTLINRSKAVVVDVSEPNEYAASHIDGAKHIPFAEVQAKIGNVVKNKATPVLLACPTGARAGKAAALLKSMGYADAVAIAGGTQAWKAANLPTTKTQAA